MRATDTSVTASIVVEAPLDRAFQVFTEDMSSWWPAGHHILQGEPAEMVFEPRLGGRIYDRGVDGSECQWSRVSGEIEVRFVAESPSRTRIDLEHRNLDRHGDGWESVRAAVGSDGGWPESLQSFAARMAG